MANLNDLRSFRLQKLDALKALGIDPYPAVSYKNVENKIIYEQFDEINHTQVVVAGRIIAIRTHGALTFIDIKDQTGKLQLYIKSDELHKADYAKNELNYNDIELLDLGDFLEAEGRVTKTERGAISIAPISIRLLTKSLRPMPSSWDGFKDKETRLRRRYVDTNMNEDVFHRFERRARFWEAHREFFKQNGFLEMNIPVLEPITGGADAKPFVTHMDVIHQDLYLRISQELYLKRLIGGGYEKVYEIGPRFRNEGLSDEHLPEHIAMEFYWAYADWKQGMEFTKEMFRYVCEKVYGRLTFSIRGFDVNLGDDWEIFDFTQIIKERFHIDIFDTSLDEIKRVLKEHNQPISTDINLVRGIDQLWKMIRQTLRGPAFMIHEPKFLSPLAKSDPQNPKLTQRFHPIFAGSETGNAWSELNDPLDQLERFKEQQRMRDAGDEEAQMLDIDYVEMLEYGMPPTFGYGHSERVFWFLEDVPAREGVPFPQLKYEIDEDSKLIYPELFTKEQKTHSTPVLQDFSKKIVVVLNKDIEEWQALNGLAHVSAYLGNKMQEPFDTKGSFLTKDSVAHPKNSQYPIIILTAKRGQMQNLMKKARESGLLYHAFISEMLENADDSVQTLLGQKTDTDVEYFAIGLFGENNAIDALTKNFSLWK